MSQFDLLEEEFNDLFKHAAWSGVGDGWVGILRQLSVDIRRLNEKLPKGQKVAYGQVKEKFGILRIYVNNPNEEVNSLVTAAEKLSGSICEDCGAPGILRGGGWLKVRCLDCQMKAHPDWVDKRPEE